MKKLLFIVLLTFSTVAFSATPHSIYNRIIKANGFWTYPKLVIFENSAATASTNGKRILLYRGMIWFVKNDHELAWVLSHELAHGKLWHTKQNPKNEYEADRQALVYMTRAGYNRCVGVMLLLRFNNPATNTHPASIDRYRRVKC